MLHNPSLKNIVTYLKQNCMGWGMWVELDQYKTPLRLVQRCLAGTPCDTWQYLGQYLPGSVAQSVASLNANPGVVSLIPVTSAI